MKSIINKISTALLATYLSGCVVAISLSGGKIDRTYVDSLDNKLVATYTGTATLPEKSSQLYHGFKVGVKNTSKVEILHDGEYKYECSQSSWAEISCQRIGSRTELFLSSELAFRNLFGENNRYEAGLTNGVHLWHDGNFESAGNSLELLLAPVRMGITSDKRTYWAPQVGFGLNYGLLQLQAGGEFYVGSKKGAGIFVNGGFAF